MSAHIAKRIAHRVNLYWMERGLNAGAYAMETERGWVVRSRMVNGWPR